MDKSKLPTVENSDGTCPGKIEVPTPREQEALAAMKSIKERVREIKERLTVLKDTGGDKEVHEVSTLEGELGRLKVVWDRWEEKRKAAARERMIILGHEKGPV